MDNESSRNFAAYVFSSMQEAKEAYEEASNILGIANDVEIMNDTERLPQENRFITKFKNCAILTLRFLNDDNTPLPKSIAINYVLSQKQKTIVEPIQMRSDEAIVKPYNDGSKAYSTPAELEILLDIRKLLQK